MFVSVKSNARLEGESISIFAIYFYTIAGCSTNQQLLVGSVETENGRHGERTVSGKGIAHSALMLRSNLFARKISEDKCT